MLKIDSFITDFLNPYFIVQTNYDTLIFEILNNGQVKQILKLDYSNIFFLRKNLINNFNSSDDKESYIFAIYYKTQNLIKIYDLFSQKLVVSLRLSNNENNITTSNNEAALKFFYLFGSTESKVFEILTVRHDCRVDFFKAQISNLHNNNEQNYINGILKWTRFEALAYVDSVEIIDLPLSDAQARIENEFGSTNSINYI